MVQSWLMHRKRVTCELHDSYFRLMTIKHAIPKILSGRLNYYIIRWRQEVSEFWRPDPLVTRCGRGSQHPAESWAPGPSVGHTNLSNKVRGIFFLKTVSLVIFVVSWWFCIYIYIYIWNLVLKMWQACK